VELADVPLEIRCAAAIECIWLDAQLGGRERRELLATALWPRRLPHRRPTPPEAPPLTETEMRAQARSAFQAGATISDLAARYGVPWTVARKWARGRAVP
jgi:hypothetical protein